MPGITLSCPDCGSLLRLPDAVPEGKKVKCPRCHSVFAGPRPELDPEPAAEPPAPRPPRTDIRPPLLLDEYAPGDETAPAGLDDRGPRLPARSVVKTRTGNRRLVAAVGVAAVLLLAGGGLAAWFLLAASALPPGTGQENLLAYLPADVVGLIGADMRALKSKFHVNPEQMRLGMVQGKVMAAAMQPGLPVAVFDVITESDQFVAGDTAQGGTIFVLRTAQPYGRKATAERFDAEESLTFRDKPYYRLKPSPFQQMAVQNGLPVAGDPWFLGMPNDRVLIVGQLPENQFQGLLAADGVRLRIGPETRALVGRVEKNDFWFVVQMTDLIRGQLAMVLQMAVNVPPELKPAVDQLTGARALYGSLSVSDQYRFGLSLICKDDAGARRTAGALRTYWDRKVKPLVAVAQLGLDPDLVAALNELTRNLRITSQGATAEVSCGVGRWTLDRAKEAVQRQIMMGAAGAGMAPVPAPAGPRR